MLEHLAGYDQIVSRIVYLPVERVRNNQIDVRTFDQIQAGLGPTSFEQYWFIRARAARTHVEYVTCCASCTPVRQPGHVLN